MDINRRNFLKGALVTGAAAAAAVALPACSPAAPSDASDAKSSSKGGETTGAKHTWEEAPEPIADIAETQDFDVVVVGAGLAGINAAEAAARNGAKTVVIERNTTFSVRGVDVGHIGSRFHKEQGFDLDPRVAARFLHQASHQTTNYDLIYVWASRSGEVFDYIEDLGSKNGVSMVPALSGTAKYGNWSTLSDRWRVYPDAVSFVRGGETYDMRDDGQPVNVTLGELVYNSAVDNGAEFVFEARAEQLVGDAASGITGVVATTKDGKHVQYNAKKGVIDPMSTAGAYAFSSASKYAPTRCATPRYMQPNRYCTSSASRKSREENIHVIKPPSTSTAREAKGLSKPGTTGTRPMRSKLAKHDVNNGLPAFATRPCKTIDACDMRHPSDTPERSICCVSSSVPTMSAPASSAARAASPSANTATRTVLPEPFGRLTVPRSC